MFDIRDHGGNFNGNKDNTLLKASDKLRLSRETTYTLNQTSTVRTMIVPFKVIVKKTGIIRIGGSVQTVYGNSIGYCQVYLNGVFKNQLTGTYTGSGYKYIDLKVNRSDVITFILSSSVTAGNDDRVSVSALRFFYDLEEDKQYLEGVDL